MPKPSLLLDLPDRRGRPSGLGNVTSYAQAAIRSQRPQEPAQQDASGTSGPRSRVEAMRRVRDARSGGIDPQLAALLDQRVIWSKAGMATVDEDAGMFGVGALSPEAANHYQRVIAEKGLGRLVGVNLRGLTPEEQQLMTQALNPDYFKRREELRQQAEQEALAQQGGVR